MVTILSIALLILVGCATEQTPSELDKSPIKHVDLTKQCGAGAALGIADCEGSIQAGRLGFKWLTDNPTARNGDTLI